MKKSTSKIVIIVSALLAIGSVATASYFRTEQTSINEEYSNQVNILNQKEDELEKLDKTYPKKQAAKSKSPNAIQVRQTNEVVEKGTALFRQLYRINSKMSDNQWQGRRNLLKRYATEKALTSTGLNYNSQGINRMYDTKIKVKRISVNTGITSDNKLDGIIQVTYNQDSNLQDSPEKDVAMYQFIYDFTTAKFITLIPLGQLTSEQI